VILGAADDGVDVIAREDVLHVRVGFAVLITIVPVHHSTNDLAAFLLHVGNGYELNVRLWEKPAQ
jgi:hypothetical protein